MFPTNDANWESSNPVETLSLFPSEINDTRPHLGDIRTTRTLSPPDTDTPIAFKSVPAGPWLIAADFLEPPRQTSSPGRVRLKRSIQKWQHLSAFVCRPSRVGAVRGVRLWPFAIGVVSGIVALTVLRSVDRSLQIPMGPELSQKAIVTAAFRSAPPPAAAVAIPEAIGDQTPAVQSRAAVERPRPLPMSPRSEPRRPVSAARFTGHLIIDSEPRGASVMINQRLVGVTPLELSRYPASSYAVWVQQDGYDRWTSGVRVPADKVTRVHAQLQRSP
jgi:hypothetical protein